MQEGVAKGAYVIKECNGTPDMLIIATGSEVSPSMEAADMLYGVTMQERGISKVLSMKLD